MDIILYRYKLSSLAYMSTWVTHKIYAKCQTCYLETFSTFLSQITVFPQMTVRQQRAVWRWLTASPPWSRGSRCRRMRFSCWSPLWPTWCAGSTCLRSNRPWDHAEDPPKVIYSTWVCFFFLSNRGIKQKDILVLCHNSCLSFKITTYTHTLFTQRGLLSLLFQFVLFLLIILLIGWLVVDLLFLSLLSSLLLDCVVLLNVLCVMCIDPALMRKSPSADSNIGKSGMLTV